MTEAERLDRVLAASWNGDAWYGPNASMILEGIDAETAATKILPGLHTIHELVFHVAAWLDEVRMLLGGAEPNMTRGFDWPEPGPVTADDWDRTRAGLGEAYRAFSEVLRALPLDRLDEVVGPERDPAEGTGLTVHAVLVGLAQHGAYHLGQIVLLAKHKRMRTD